MVDDDDKEERTTTTMNNNRSLFLLVIVKPQLQRHCGRNGSNRIRCLFRPRHRDYICLIITHDKRNSCSEHIKYIINVHEMYQGHSTLEEAFNVEVLLVSCLAGSDRHRANSNEMVIFKFNQAHAPNMTNSPLFID